MGKKIEPELKKVCDYLKLNYEEEFVIPAYQRGYSWNDIQLDKLWDDIVNYDENSRDNHFFGTVIISLEDNDTKFVLVDGQQRTTTFLILLKALLIRINDALKNFTVDEETEELYNGLKNRRKSIMEILYKIDKDRIKDQYDDIFDNNIYKDESIRVLENNSINEEYKEELINILRSKDIDEAEKNAIKIRNKKFDNKYSQFFRNFKYLYENKIKDLEKDTVSSIAKKFLEKCELIVIKSWQMEQAINMFNSLNSDGMPLEDSDIISSKMYVEAQRLNKENQFKQLWQDLLSFNKELVYVKKQELNPILTQHMYYIRALKGETKTKTGVGIDVTTPGLRKYYLDINKEIIQNPIETTNKMLILVTIWKEIQKIPIIELLLQSNDNAKIFMAGYLYRFVNKYNSYQEVKMCVNDIIVIAECLLRLFIVLELVDVGYSSKYFKTFLFGIENDFVDVNITDSAIKEKFDSHINKCWEKDQIYDWILEYEGNFLVKVDEYLFAKQMGKDFKFSEKVDIEHIMPKSGKNIVSIMNDAEIKDKDEFNYYIDKLGNKILLETSINRTIGNAWFREKILEKINDKKGYVNSIYPNAIYLVNEYKNKKEKEIIWTKKEIIKHTDIKAKRIIDFVFGY